MSFYESIPLDPTRREIRVLRLAPGSRDETPKATLKCVSLDDNPEYNVLSYAWGSNSDLVAIEVQGEEFLVTRNLYQCLVNLRHETEALSIWVDAICINQRSNEEKNTQVPLMRDVYKFARQAYVWLGEATDGLKLVVASMKAVEIRGESAKWERLEQLQEGLDVTPGAIVDAFAEFANLPWFRRTWIIQEFALPQQDPIFVFGPHRVSYPIVHQWWKAVRGCNSHITSHDELAQGDPAWRKLHSLISALPLPKLISVRMMLFMEGVAEKGLPLSVLISISEGSLATNARDKVYGVMGLANAEVTKKIKIDYNQPVEDLYEDACRHIIFDEGKLNILSSQSRDLQWLEPDAESGRPTKNFAYRVAWGENVTATWIRDFSHVPERFRETSLLPDWHGGGSCTMLR